MGFTERKSFIDYVENFQSENHEAVYFGWISNKIPEYGDTLEIKVNVETQNNNQRPMINIQKSNDYGNQFVKDYFEVITEEDAIERIKKNALKRIDTAPNIALPQ